MNRIIILIFTLLIGCGKDTSFKNDRLSSKSEKKNIENRQIPYNKVCMYYDVELNMVSTFPVNINGKTYYGCCNETQANLYTDSTKRVAIEPITQKTIDKSEALIFLDLDKIKDNKVLYFESKENHDKYLLARKETSKKTTAN